MLRVDARFDGEMTHSAIEGGRLWRWQRRNVNRCRIRFHLKFFLHRLLYVAKYAANLFVLNHSDVVVARGDGEFARLLREENALLQLCHHIVFAAHALNIVQRWREWQIFNQEAVERRLQSGHKLRYLIFGVQLYGAHHRLLLVDVGFRHGYAHKQILATHRFACFLSVDVVETHRATTLLSLRCRFVGRKNFDAERLGSQAFAIDHHRSSPHVVGTCLHRFVGHGVFHRRAARAHAVHPLLAVGCRYGRAVNLLCSLNLGGSERTAFAIAQHIHHRESVALNHLARCLCRKRHSGSLCRKRRHRKCYYDCLQ